MIDTAQRVISQHFDDPAVPDLTTCALLHHALELGLERYQAGDPGLDLGQLPPCDQVGRLAGLVRPI